MSNERTIHGTFPRWPVTLTEKQAKTFSVVKRIRDAKEAVQNNQVLFSKVEHYDVPKDVAELQRFIFVKSLEGIVLPEDVMQLVIFTLAPELAFVLFSDESSPEKFVDIIDNKPSAKPQFSPRIDRKIISLEDERRRLLLSSTKQLFFGLLRNPALQTPQR